MYLLSEHAILVKVVLRESILETAILQNSNDFIEFVCSDIELNCFKYVGSPKQSGFLSQISI